MKALYLVLLKADVITDNKERHNSLKETEKLVNLSLTSTVFHASFHSFLVNLPEALKKKNQQGVSQFS